MSERKWHKNCGGKVVYQKPIEEGVGFKQAGFCKKCEGFPIIEENIIFEIDNDKVERCFESGGIPSWRIVLKKKIPEELD